MLLSGHLVIANTFSWNWSLSRSQNLTEKSLCVGQIYNRQLLYQLQLFGTLGTFKLKVHLCIGQPIFFVGK